MSELTHSDMHRLYDIARRDVERSFNTQTPFGCCYSAGDFGNGFSGLVFNRDISYSGILGLNALYPREMLESLKVARECRRRLGFACFEACGSLLEGVEGVICEPLSPNEFFRKYQKASAINKTDDVCWLWCAGELMHCGVDEWAWLYENGSYCFDKLYAPFYDPNDGLYFGQPTFIDVGHNGYPDGWNTPTQENRNRCVWVKAASTNCLYYKGLRVMAEAAEVLGHPDEAAAYSARADRLGEAIRARLKRADGGYYYFLHRDGSPEPRRDALGSAFAVLCGVDSSPEVTADYPVLPSGAPLLHPFYKRPDGYHNNSCWYFASEFFLRAKGVSAEERLAVAASAFDGESFREYFDLNTGEPSGSPAQLWTMAAFLGAYADSRQ